MAVGKIFKRVAITTYLVIVHVMAAFFVWQTIFPSGTSFFGAKPESIADPAPSVSISTPLPVPSELSNPAQTPSGSDPNLNAPTPSQQGEGLLIPVQGVRPEQLVDTFSTARSEGRTHDAIDIMAPAGTPVLAAANGTIAKFFDSKLGGITIYQLTRDGKYYLYYAHLQSRSSTLKEGDTVTKGTTIGFVGDTGNAGPGNYHLHFAITIAADPKRFWEGTPIDPFPILKEGRPLP
jgi:murein DD-endopeptidase MepM/ murein hydrolase activator NlpD